jgi:hypothetical protein
MEAQPRPIGGFVFSASQPHVNLVRPRAALLGARRRLRKVAHEAERKFLCHLPRRSPDQVVIVEKPLGRLRESDRPRHSPAGASVRVRAGARTASWESGCSTAGPVPPHPGLRRLRVHGLANPRPRRSSLVSAHPQRWSSCPPRGVQEGSRPPVRDATTCGPRAASAEGSAHNKLCNPIEVTRSQNAKTGRLHHGDAANGPTLTRRRSLPRLLRPYQACRGHQTVALCALGAGDSVFVAT